ncbi:MAG: nickel pincer cofactor biosynthesis protein LarC [Bacteroidetes bacterium]|nr:nickel pincer cofactor biosynthesis protein LarC [Bacteroidota bacterium]MCW5896564.1 nickel pincer cofactor biosynthesis protein LarC [Bacteroidota bacterium]
MKIAYLDTIAGIAGDMTLAAFVNAGMPLDELSSELKKLPLNGFELIGRHVMRNSISAVHIDVAISHTPHYHRHLKDINAIIDGSTLSQRVKEDAKSIFHVIGEAEAKVHNTTLEKIHFHEVGALDSIVDIVGVAICLEKFGIERVYTSPVRLGSGGLVKTQHGVMPTPAPATMEILRNYPTVLTDIPEELTTPTGAGIVKALSAGVLDDEEIHAETIGYGSGTKEFAQIPNLLRIVIGELESHTGHEQIVTVETNIDDMNPQVYPYLIDKLIEAGAHDAYLIPIIMKKGRPGILLSVMTGKSRLETITHIIYKETSTIGLRIQEIGRRRLPREHVEVQTQFGPVKAKAVTRNGSVTLSPEFEECRRIAGERGIPLLRVQEELLREFSSRKS